MNKYTFGVVERLGLAFFMLVTWAFSFIAVVSILNEHGNPPEAMNTPLQWFNFIMLCVVLVVCFARPVVWGAIKQYKNLKAWYND